MSLLRRRNSIVNADLEPDHQCQNRISDYRVCVRSQPECCLSKVIFCFAIVRFVLLLFMVFRLFIGKRMPMILLRNIRSLYFRTSGPPAP